MYLKILLGAGGSLKGKSELLKDVSVGGGESESGELLDDSGTGAELEFTDELLNSVEAKGNGDSATGEVAGGCSLRFGGSSAETGVLYKVSVEAIGFKKGGTGSSIVLAVTTGVSKDGRMFDSDLN